MGQSETRAGLSFASEKAGLGSRWRVPAPTVQLSRAAPFPHPSLGTPVGIGWVAPAFLFVTAGNTLFLSEADRRPFVPPACIVLSLMALMQWDPGGPGRDREGHCTNRPHPSFPCSQGKATLWPLGTDAQEDGIGLWEAAGRKWGGSLKWPLAVPRVPAGKASVGHQRGRHQSLGNKGGFKRKGQEPFLLRKSYEASTI